MCPYEKKHFKNSKIVRKEVVDSLENWEKHELKDLLSHISNK